MITIFEGADLVGKTTLAREYSKENNLIVIKKDFIGLKTVEFLKKETIELISKVFFNSIFPLGTRFDFILDRSLLSSLVYSTFFNRNVDNSWIHKYFLDDNYKHSIETFLVISDEKSISHRMEIRGEILFSIEQILQIQDLFIKISETFIREGANIKIIKNYDK